MDRTTAGPVSRVYALAPVTVRVSSLPTVMLSASVTSVVWFFALRSTPDRAPISDPTELLESETAAKPGAQASHAKSGEAEHGAKKESSKSEGEHAKAEKKSSAPHGEAEHARQRHRCRRP